MDYHCDFIMGGPQAYTCGNLHSDPSGLCTIHRKMPGLRLQTLLETPNKGECHCLRILGSDKTRHFKECPLRAKYPGGPPDERQRKVDEVLAEAREVIAEYIDGDTPRLELGKAALATIDHIDALSGR